MTLRPAAGASASCPPRRPDPARSGHGARAAKQYCLTDLVSAPSIAPAPLPLGAVIAALLKGGVSAPSIPPQPLQVRHDIMTDYGPHVSAPSSLRWPLRSDIVIILMMFPVKFQHPRAFHRHCALDTYEVVVQFGTFQPPRAFDEYCYSTNEIVAFVTISATSFQDPRSFDGHCYVMLTT